MDPCVYTTQHGRWLRAAVGDWPTPVCFRSGKRWKKAHQLLTPPATLRVLFREQDERCFRHQLLLPRPYLVLTKPLRLDIQCQRGASVKIGWKYLDD